MLGAWHGGYIQWTLRSQICTLIWDFSPAWLGKSTEAPRRAVLVGTWMWAWLPPVARYSIRLKSNDLHLKFKYSVHFVCVVFKALTAWNQTAFDALSLAISHRIHSVEWMAWYGAMVVRIYRQPQPTTVISW